MLLPLCRLVEPTRGDNLHFPVDRALLSALVDRWRPETHTFHLPIGEMAMTLQDVSMFFGLPHEGRAVGARAVGPHWRQEMLERFAGVIEAADDEPAQMQFTEKDGPTKAWLL